MYKSPSNTHQVSMFWDLASMLNLTHPMYKLANLINWETFERSFAPLYCKDNGRMAKPIRLMVGLIVLKHIRNVSDESVVEQFSENAYYQYFCGMESFHHRQTLRTDRTRGVPPSHWRGGYGVDSQREHPSQPAA